MPIEPYLLHQRSAPKYQPLLLRTGAQWLRAPLTSARRFSSSLSWETEHATENIGAAIRSTREMMLEESMMSDYNLFVKSWGMQCEMKRSAFWRTSIFRPAFYGLWRRKSQSGRPTMGAVTKGVKRIEQRFSSRYADDTHKQFTRTLQSERKIQLWYCGFWRQDLRIACKECQLESGQEMWCSEAVKWMRRTYEVDLWIHRYYFPKQVASHSQVHRRCWCPPELTPVGRPYGVDSLYRKMCIEQTWEGELKKSTWISFRRTTSEENSEYLNALP